METIETLLPIRIQTSPLTSEAYLEYGDVIFPRDEITPIPANMGTAQRFNFLAQLENHRGKQAKANLCLFRCNPQLQGFPSTFEPRLLERHVHSTQVFIPMQGADRYLVIVCRGAHQPNLKTLRAFVASNSQGVTYKPGVWHHPLIALDRQTDFACLVWEDGSQEDCEVVSLTPSIQITIKQ